MNSSDLEEIIKKRRKYVNKLVNKYMNNMIRKLVNDNEQSI